MHKENIAPIGHKYLQNGRCTMINTSDKIIMLMISAIFDPDSASFLSNPNINPIINCKTNTIYFTHLRYLSPLIDFLLNGKGILYSQSCNHPKGQILQTTHLPNIRPVIIIKANKLISKIPFCIFYIYFKLFTKEQTLLCWVKKSTFDTNLPRKFFISFIFPSHIFIFRCKDISNNAEHQSPL
ncbi:hypothetical protein EZS27_023791 [termite gut metagenome]|uniref:Uncharacterized protein n=1 Tax=termite gut metagenome TaxID=433724 RepID=A0A5J4R3B5_9ZZZZ